MEDLQQIAGGLGAGGRLRGLAIFIYLTAVFVGTYQKLNTSHGEASFDSNLINAIVMFFKDTFPSLKLHGGPQRYLQRELTYCHLVACLGIFAEFINGLFIDGTM